MVSMTERPVDVMQCKFINIVIVLKIFTPPIFCSSAPPQGIHPGQFVLFPSLLFLISSYN